MNIHTKFGLEKYDNEYDYKFTRLGNGIYYNNYIPKLRCTCYALVSIFKGTWEMFTEDDGFYSHSTTVNQETINNVYYIIKKVNSMILVNTRWYPEYHKSIRYPKGCKAFKNMVRCNTLAGLLVGEVIDTEKLLITRNGNKILEINLAWLSVYTPIIKMAIS